MRASNIGNMDTLGLREVSGIPKDPGGHLEAHGRLKHSPPL